MNLAVVKLLVEDLYVDLDARCKKPSPTARHHRVKYPLTSVFRLRRTASISSGGRSTRHTPIISTPTRSQSPYTGFSVINKFVHCGPDYWLPTTSLRIRSSSSSVHNGDFPGYTCEENSSRRAPLNIRSPEIKALRYAAILPFHSEWLRLHFTFTSQNVFPASLC